MQISYKKIYPVRRAKFEIVDHYYGECMGDFLPDEDCREIELTRIKNIIMRGRLPKEECMTGGSTFMPIYDFTNEVYI